MSQTSQSSDESDLLATLLAGKLISQAQADLVKSDHELTGMSLGEILLARHWVSAEKLFEIAPWLKESTQASELEAARMVAKTSDGHVVGQGRSAGSGSDTGKASAGDYQRNYEAYLKIVQRVLDDN